MGNSVDGDRQGGKPDIDVARMYVKAGEGSLEQKNYKNAITFLTKGLAMQKKLCQRNDLSLVNTCTKLGVAYQGLGDLPQALEFYKKALRKAERKQHHEKISGLYGAIGYIYEKQNKLDKAKEKYNQGLQEARGNLGPQSLVIGNISYQAGMLYIKLEDYKKAMKYLQEALYVLVKYYGEGHTTVGDCYNLMGLANFKQGKVKIALEYYRRAEKIREEKLASDDLELATLYCNIGLALDALGEYKEALKYLNKSFGIEIKHFAVDHGRIQSSIKYIGMVSKMIEKTSVEREEIFDELAELEKLERADLEMEKQGSYSTIQDSIYDGRSKSHVEGEFNFDEFIESATMIKT